MKKLVSILLVIAVIFSFSACAKPEDKAEIYEKDGYTDGIIKGSERESYAGEKSTGGIFDWLMPSGKVKADSLDIKGGPEAAPTDDWTYNPYWSQEKINAGTLTASEYKDINDIAAWKKLINDNNWYKIAEDRNIFTNNIIKVKVSSGDATVFNEKVELLADKKTIFTAKTGVDGVAVLAYNVSAKNEKPTAIKVGNKTVAYNGETEITVETDTKAKAVKKLDLMLMIDTTGSMGDELRYITEELKDVVKRVAGSNEAIAIRTSVNFYRDETDEYVVKFFDFREDIDECIKQLSEQEANGGGDYPEAVHKALDNAVNGHTWDEDAVKLCFLVLDAPPHSKEEVQGVNESLVKSVTSAAEKGIRIIPVVASGADDDTEYLCRSFAAVTGGTFIYLTDDSGIGYEHHKPEVPEQEVEFLNECMIRVVCEYCGLEYTAPDYKEESVQ